MLAHATKLNYDCLRIMCGDMKIILTAKEKSLWFIDRNEIKVTLDKFKAIASKLTGENDTEGLIPNAIVSCSDSRQDDCIYIIEFLNSWCNLPLVPIYFRGAMKMKLYKLAEFLISSMPDIKFSSEYLIGPKGLLTNIKNNHDVPNRIIIQIASYINSRVMSSKVIGDFIILCMNNCNSKVVKKLLNDVSENKLTMISIYVGDNDEYAIQKLNRLLKVD